MKRILTISVLALCLMSLCLLPSLGLAASKTHSFDDPLRAYTAYLNQNMALRSGPGTNYTELGTYGQNTPIVLYEKEIGGSVTWGMVEFRGNGGLIRAYTGMKRIDTDTADIPWANTVTYVSTLQSDLVPRRGPGSEYAPCNKVLYRGTRLLLYHEERGYVMADFYFQGDSKLTRAWIPVSALIN